MRKLVTAPNKVLGILGRYVYVTKEEDFIRDLRRDLSRVMKKHKALGITACQIGEAVDFFIINQHKLQGAKKFNYFINALATGEGEKIDSEESCLSIPGKAFKVKRYPKIIVTSHMFNGETRKRTFTGLTARCIQQEMDHVKGILLSDIGECVREF